MRKLYLVFGFASLALGAAGIVLPLLPTTPFVILAAYCFGRGDPRVERWLLEHRVFGPAIRQWRMRGAVSRRGKVAATFAFAVSIGLAVIFVPLPWTLLPVVAALVTGTWLWSRPEA